MDLRVKVAILEKNELKNKVPLVRRTADLALFSLPRVLFQQEDKKDKSEHLFSSSRVFMLSHLHTASETFVHHIYKK